MSVETMKIEPVTVHNVAEARQLVLNGLLDYFAELDKNMNPDLYGILQTYTQPGSLFVVGIIGNSVVATGAFYKERDKTARICRMSVAKTHRRKGLAKQILDFLEMKAIEFGFEQLVIETTVGWEKPIKLYKSHGYHVTHIAHGEVHLQKSLIY
ncbi:GNAT family N-acetyltransferase [Bacillus sp. T33-2]|uniref:GNAT family N-acetyltransferase n=1 Tax=Bacillus sp. T33-2 TaxID=2054168 RepID=UPI000C75862D|nr:GNAT family N-acetyltransferase [Bacillus sp. T33-2]PLR94436.1 GNAT family N-acetyltransferase [Bacillus sp. T33-2]